MTTKAVQLVADENIAALEQSFASLASIRRVDGRSLDKTDLQGADALLVRSVTPVDEALLANSSVQFVGSATIGTDHVDLDYLAQRNIRFCHAPGSNADSVADYLCSALAAIVPKLEAIAGHGLRAGIVGLGQVGSRFAARLQTLGYEVSAHDPFLQSAEFPLKPLEEVLHSDLVSINVPLTDDGQHPTRRLLSADRLKALPARVILMNTSRGAVIDGMALKNWMIDQPGAHAVLDVWENEPDIDPELASLVSIATPHIAGYALDGKLRGTAMLAAEFAAYFTQPLVSAMDHPESLVLQLSGAESLNDILLRAYDVRLDDHALRKVLSKVDSRKWFDQLRRDYPMRREYAHHNLQFAARPSNELLTILTELGFTVS